MAGSIPRGDKNLGVSCHNDTTGFSNILGDVVFVLSGFVNPERGMLRSQAMKMGAEYQSDWNEDCTLLVCAFPNTPKYIQVKDCCGTIVSREWISKCYALKKLVEIDAYLMHAGRPWRRNIFQDSTPLSHTTSQNLTESSQLNTPSGSLPNESEHLNSTAIFSPLQVKEWSLLDLDATILWLQSQEEKPEASEIKSIASEGILTCLQDAIDCIKNKQKISVMIKEWRFVPRIVKEMAKIEEEKTDLGIKRRDLLNRAVVWKGIYEMELKRSENSDDETVEMTVEEIEDAYNHVRLFNPR